MFFLFVVVLIHLHRGLFFTRSVELSPCVKLCWQSEKKKASLDARKTMRYIKYMSKMKMREQKQTKKKGEKAVTGFFMIPEKKDKRGIFF